MSLKSPKETNNYTDDFDSTSNINQTNMMMNTTPRSRRNDSHHNNSTSKVSGLSSNELKSKLIQVVKNKGIYDIMKVLHI
jgi:hypothetical protein